MELGEIEKNVLEYHFNQLRGELVIKINDQEVKKVVRVFNEPIREVHDFEVGTTEKLQVTIERERGLLFGQKTRVFINNRLAKAFAGM